MCVFLEIQIKEASAVAITTLEVSNLGYLRKSFVISQYRSRIHFKL